MRVEQTICLQLRVLGLADGLVDIRVQSKANCTANSARQIGNREYPPLFEESVL